MILLTAIDIISLPKLSFAHTYSTNKYQNKFSKKNNFLEISYITEGSLTVKVNGEVYVAKKGDVLCLLPENEITVYTNEQHSHHTVGVDVDWEFSENTLQGIYLPTLTPASHGTEDIHAIIDDFILKRERYSASNAKFAAKFLDILCKIDKCARKYNNIQHPKEVLYVEQAKNYISRNINKPITQKEIAESLKISPGYLCNIFKKTEKTTVIKYINNLKLEKIKVLIEKENAYLYEAAALYGYDDPNYVSALFKKTFGYNITKLL